MSEVTTVVTETAGSVAPAAAGMFSMAKDTVVGVVRSNPIAATAVASVVATATVGWIGYKIYKSCKKDKHEVKITGDAVTGKVTVE